MGYVHEKIAIQRRLLIDDGLDMEELMFGVVLQDIALFDMDDIALLDEVVVGDYSKHHYDQSL